LFELKYFKSGIKKKKRTILLTDKWNVDLWTSYLAILLSIALEYYELWLCNISKNILTITQKIVWQNCYMLCYCGHNNVYFINTCINCNKILYYCNNKIQHYSNTHVNTEQRSSVTEILFLFSMFFPMIIVQYS